MGGGREVWENMEKYRLGGKVGVSLPSTGQGKGYLFANHGVDGGEVDTG